ncbi:MAG TPA: sugar-binding domain-containing protein [Jatrophihabitans sp.]
MARQAAASPSEMVLATRVARLYFIDDKSKVEIAEQLDISRFRVARLLESARAMGIVRIEIGMPGTLDVALSAELAAGYGLRYAFVYDFGDDADSSLRHRLGEAAGEAIADIATTSDVVGVAWARSLFDMARSMTGFPSCPLVQMTGALSRTGGEDLLDLVRALTRINGGPSYGFYAPMIVGDERAAKVISSHPDVAKAFAMQREITIAMVGIGAWQKGASSIYDALDEQDRDAISACGAHAEISGVFIDEEGRAIATPLDNRMIVTSERLLAQIPTVLAVAYGSAKVSAVRAALNGGLVNGLITHASLARDVLALPRGDARPAVAHAGRG